MIKKDIVEKVVERTGLNKVIVKKVIDDFLSVVFNCFENKERVELRNFGVFYFKKIKSKKARNPKTKEEIIIPERLKLIFKPSKKLKFK
ncbi:MAG: HU family DNA-binding protein [Candidatus Ratteibacteria bacterium]